ncbi:MAG: hypothetical protein WKF57_09450 [Nakamurella sp.]
MNLLRVMATGVIVNPAAGSPTDNSTVVDALNWTFIRSRTVSAPIADVIAWYETNIRAPEASQPPTLIDSTLYPAGRTPELAAAENAFVRPQVTIRFTEITDTSTRVDVVATGYHRDEHPQNSFIPAEQIVTAELNRQPNDSRPARIRTIGRSDAGKLIEYLNRAPLKPVLTYTGTTGGATFTITFTAQDGRIYTAHWNSDAGGGAAGVALELGADRSQLVDPDRGFYELLRQLSES